MEIGMVGLGRMGANMVRRMLRGGLRVVAFDQSATVVSKIASEGAVPAGSLAELVSKLSAPRAVWVMVPAGAPTDAVVEGLTPLLGKGDVIIDGGNTFYKDDVRRSQMLANRQIDYLDVGTSGGVWGLERGYCLMIGGPKPATERLEPVFRCLAPGPGKTQAAGPRTASSTAVAGFLHCGPAGAGHFVKMVHNGIEYGLMQSYAEGFELMAAMRTPAPGADAYAIDLAAVAELWRRGSVVGSWLLDLAAAALNEDPNLAGFTGQVADSGEGRWTVASAVEQGVPLNTLTAALFARFHSQRDHGFGDKLLSAMRFQFGGHTEPTK